MAQNDTVINGWQPVIGLEVHVQLLTNTKLFSPAKNKFGEAGRKVVVEEHLTGIELSVFVLTDGGSYKMLPSAKDYKRIGEGDTGLNTGGMGAVSPVPFVDRFFIEKVERDYHAIWM